MRLALDTDALWKLGLCGLLAEVASLFGLQVEDFVCLPAAPHQLRRGRLRRKLGDDTCELLIPVVEEIRRLTHPDGDVPEELVAAAGIDPGEALLFAMAATDAELFVVTGDKRAVRVLAGLRGIADIVGGRVIVLEALFLALARRMGVEMLRDRVAPLVPHDRTIGICFGRGTQEPLEALQSYYEDLVSEVPPGFLWDPEGETAT